MSVATFLAPLLLAALPLSSLSGLPPEIWEVGRCPQGTEVRRAEGMWEGRTLLIYASAGRAVLATRTAHGITRLYLATLAPNGDLTLVREELYDPATHRGPCQDWLEVPAA